MKTAHIITIAIGIILLLLSVVFKTLALFGLSVLIIIFGLIMKPENKKQTYRDIKKSCRDMDDLKDTNR